MCEVVKSFHGWQATTNIDVGNGHALQFLTMKRHGGALVTTATRVTLLADGGTSYMAFFDFKESVISDRVRVTANAVKAQHLAALERVDEVKARMNAFYEQKAEEQAIA